MKIHTLLLFTVLIPTLGQAQSLSLDQYKGQVRSSDPGWKAVEATEKGSQLLTEEADALTAIQFTSQLGYLNDKRPTVNPGFQGDRTENKSFNFGLKQQTAFGLQWALTQNYSHTTIYDAAPTAVPMPDYYDSYPRLDFTFSLWRNFLGSELASQAEQIAQQSMARRQQSEIARVQKDMEIESAFYGVLAQQQSIEILKDSLGRANRVLEWTRSRIGRNLADGSDIYQSQAAVAARKVDITSAQKNLTDAITRFNSLRGVVSSELTEKLIAPEVDLSKLNLSKNQKRVRKDIRARQAQATSLQASYEAQREKHKPQLDLSFSGMTQGRDNSYSAASSKAFSDNKDYMLVALTLTVPLNQSDASDFREGYAELVKAQKLSNESNVLDERLTWESTAEQARQLREQIAIIRELEGLQKNKSNSEREKFNRGRSTLFQVLSYEQDYLVAQNQRINLELQARQFITQLNLFE